MPLTAPQLDSRTFEDLVAEAKARIPRYTPEWTDFNESDPGIVLVQLHAWLTETILYQLNRVPDAQYVKFLQLVGIDRTPAAPARADVSFALKKTVTDAVVIPRGTRIGVADPDLEQPPVFETDRSMVALPGRLAEVFSVPSARASGGVPARRTVANATPGSGYAAFRDDAPQSGDALYLGIALAAEAFPRDEIGVLVLLPDPSLDALVGTSAAPPPPATTCTGLRTTAPAGRSLVWEAYQGPIAAGRRQQWRAVDVTQDDTLGLTRSGYVFLRAPAGFPRENPFEVAALVEPDSHGDVPELFWLRVRVEDIEDDATPPRLDGILLNAVSATAAQTVADEIVGSSDGRPGQTFTLRRTPVLADPPVELEVDEGQGPVAWEQVDDFGHSGRSDAHFVLRRQDGVITFGDGVHGRIPVAGVDNVIARGYRYGGGLVGNVGAGTIRNLQSAIPQVDTVGNRRSAAGGADEEAEDAAKLRAPDVIRTRERAVTADDFRLLAEETPGANIARAVALPLLDPEQPGVDVPGAVTVLVVPATAGDKPFPDAATLDLVCAYLDERRLLTTELYLRGPHYADVQIEIEAVARNDSELRDVDAAVRAAVSGFLHPLRGGEDGAGWPFGGTIHHSDLLRAALTAPGVRRIGTVSTWLDGAPQPACTDVAIGDGALVYLSRLDVAVAYEH